VTTCQRGNDCRAGSIFKQTHNAPSVDPPSNEFNIRQRPVSWLAVVSRSAFPGLQGKSSGIWIANAAYSCGGSCGIGVILPAPHSRFTFYEGTDDIG
jgi:hypothetical protein